MVNWMVSVFDPTVFGGSPMDAASTTASVSDDAASTTASITDDAIFEMVVGAVLEGDPGCLRKNTSRKSMTAPRGCRFLNGRLGVDGNA
mmetsp:Transcript_20730/g.48980  ORF Transcript_20730/g.48980 Transcript_20730/m.48980 type:complete len:89 (-) Transcript_20730:358-624(-)